MNRFWTSIVFVIFTFLVSQNVYAFNTYQVGEEITGREYNDVLERWFNKKFSIWVGISGHTEYIAFQGETGLGNATVWVRNSKTIRTKLRKSVVKAIEWSEVARKNKVDTIKSLDYFDGRDGHPYTYRHGTSTKKNEMSLKFFATNSGKQTDLIISLVDQDNQFIKTPIYICLQEMKKMLNAIYT